VIVIYTLKGLASYGQEVLLSRIGNNIIAMMQRRIFDKVLGQDLGFFQQNASSDLITRLTANAQAASSALNLLATSLGRDLLTVISLLIVMIATDPLLTAIALIGMPLLLVVVARLLKRVRKLFSSEVRSLASIIATMQETVHGIRIIKAFRLEDAMRARMNESVTAVERLSNRMVKAQAATNPLIDALGGVAVASGEKLLERAGVRMAVDPAASAADRELQFATFQIDAPACDNCGAITVRNGNLRRIPAENKRGRRELGEKFVPDCCAQSPRLGTPVLRLLITPQRQEGFGEMEP
jgi:ATP-binding cassette subfamily B protein